MNFVLNGSILFEPEEQKISLSGAAESSVKLSAPTTRLLMELIRNKRVNVSRGTLITRVWQDFGYTPSGHNLNKAVSELRKAFRMLGVKNSLIVTQPKDGFYFDAEVVEYTYGVEGKANERNMTSDMAMTSPATVTTHSRGKGWKYYVLYSIALLVSAFLGVAIYYFCERVSLENNKLIIYNGEIGKCSVWRVNALERPLDLSKLSTLLTEHKIDCKNTKYSIYYFSARFSIKSADETFIGACPEDEVSLCQSIRYKGGDGK